MWPLPYICIYRKKTGDYCLYKKGFSFAEIVNFLNINARTLVNYLGRLTTYFILPYSDSLYKYIIDNIIASSTEEYHILLTNQRRYYV